MSCSNAGGRVTITINGVRYSARANITVKPWNVAIEGGANYDGTFYTTVEPKPAEMSFTLSDKCDLKLQDLQGMCGIDVTAVLEDVVRTYLFTNATIVGEPEIDVTNGEISGLMVQSQEARQIDG